MKNDIDFDELDKAVGAVLNSKPTVQPGDDISSQAVSTEPQADEAKVEVKPALKETAAVKPVKTETKTAKPASPALKRSGGRFMDMVHPSADMKKSTATAPINHSGNKLQPLSKDVKPTEETAKSEPAPVAASQTDYEPGPPADLAASGFVSMPDDDKAVANTPAENVWPDPIEAGKNESESVEPQPDTKEPAAESSVEPTPEPADGPFLSDQKVEKRPLGAFAGGEATEDDQTADNPVGSPAEQTTVPPELQPEAVEAEASEVPEKPEEETPAVLDDMSSKTQTAASDEAEKPAEVGLDDMSPKSEKSEEPKAEPDDKSPVDTVNLSGQSIAPQYKPESTDNDSSKAASSVFDTKEYHQPLAPSAGQNPLKKVAGVIGLVILLVLIGAAIGYAYYVYRTGGF